MKNYFYAWIVIFATALVQAQGAELAGGLPGNCRVGYLIRGTNVFKVQPALVPQFRMKLSPAGRPNLLMGNCIARLLTHTNEQPVVCLLPKEGRAADDFCWLTRKIMAVIAGDTLGIIEKDRFIHRQKLPEQGMRLEPAGQGSCYLFGGTSEKQRCEVFLCGTNGNIAYLFHAPSPVTALAGDGKTTLAAVGSLVIFFVEGQAPVPVFAADDEIRALALAAPDAVFYATKNRVGYHSISGKGFVFLNVGTEQLCCDGRSLYLQTLSGDILQIEPVSGFVSVSKQLTDKPPQTP